MKGKPPRPEPWTAHSAPLNRLLCSFLSAGRVWLGGSHPGLQSRESASLLICVSAIQMGVFILWLST